MDLINPWIDPIEVRRLADSLMNSGRDSSPPTQETGFANAFVGFTDEIPVSTAPLSAPDILQIPAPVPVETWDTLVRETFQNRIQSFCDRMRHQFKASDFFILDAQGNTILDESGHGRLLFIGRNLAKAPRRPSMEPGNVRIKMNAESTLEVIPVQTLKGFFVLGALVTESLSPTAIQAIADAFELIASQPEN